MEWGSRLEVLQKAAKMGGELPPSLANRPKLSIFQQPYYDAFQYLNGSRNWTMGGPTAIPFSEIASYLAVNSINNAEEREEYIMYIQALDNAYLSHHFNKKGKP